MKFIDLFAGIGGFHKALHELNHECVFASEINPLLQNLYKENWGIEAKGDIKKIVKEEIDSIPEHDILCAGFPCQPFSKAGNQEGMKDKERGTLFDEIVKVLKFRKPKYFILENVPFIAKHNNEETWEYMKSELENSAGYKVDHEIYSPHEFGIPQHRKRIFIIGSRIGLDHFKFADIEMQKSALVNIHQFIEEHPKEFRKLPKSNQECIRLWQQFIDCIPKKTKLPGFPIWGMEFGATYPYDGMHPFRMTRIELEKYKGNFGTSLSGLEKKQQFEKLPSYARVEKAFPDWKKRYISQTRDFYKEHKSVVQDVVNEIAKSPSQSWQKLEWNVGDSKRKINNYIIQFRASGIRVKKVDFFPSLVCTNTQIPIIGWQNRYITKKEGAKLQSLEGLKFPENDTTCFQALGNAVNSKIVKMIAEKLIVETPLQPIADNNSKKSVQHSELITTH